MTGKFLCVFTEDDKKDLLSLGYQMIKEDIINGEKTYVFLNDSVKEMDFSKKANGEYLFTNKLFF